ncbi:MAG TPA: asparagine synthase-related protein [Gemmatimonadaceae bacterium]
MSGIAAAVCPAARPADTEYFRRWARSLAELATEGAVNLHCGERACLAHAPLHVYPGDPRTQQPVTLDGSSWITADARLDGIEDLRRELRANGREPAPAASDAELILHAYGVWGRDCVEHIIGDFAFLLWDEPRQLLLGATDHFGVRPLYYADTAEGLVVSNWGATVHAHRAVDRTPDDAALVAFLAEGQVPPGATAFTGIRVLQRASRLVYADGRLSIDRYWTLPVEEPLLYADERQYVEQFLELLKVSVADRIRDARAALFMSGGLDSPAIAVAALSLGIPRSRITAHTAVFDHLIPDNERRYATKVASHLGIPIRIHPADDYVPFERFAELAAIDPVPSHAPLIAAFHDQMEAAASTGAVVITGHGTDAILAPESLGHLLVGTIRGQRRAVLRHAPRHFLMYGRRPPLGILPTLARLRGAWSPRGGDSTPDVGRPAWLRRGTEEPVADAPSEGSAHPFRRDAYRITAGDWVPATVSSFTPMARRQRASCVHPFIDLRMVRFCLRLPPVPLCWDKHLLRASLADSLPAEITRRPKTPMRADRLLAAVRRRPPGWLPVTSPGAVTSRYYSWPDFVSLERLMGGDPWIHSRPISLELFAGAWSRAETIS